MENNLFTEELQKKMFNAQRRMRWAQRDLFMYKALEQMAQEKRYMQGIAKKVTQLDFLAG